MIENKLIWGSLITVTLLFTGCGSDENTIEKASGSDVSPVFVIAKSTLANATVCIDSNMDAQCQVDEVQTKSSDDGSFELSYDVENYTNAQLIAQDGFNLITLRENSGETVVVGSLDEASSHNINTLTTLIQEAVGTGLSYDEAKKYVASRYNLESDYIDLDPLELLKDQERQAYFLSIRAMEIYSEVEERHQNVLLDDFISQPALLNLQSRRSSVRQDAAEPISIEDADTAISNTNIFDFDLDAYLQRLSELISGFFDDLLAFFGFGDVDDGYKFDAATLEPLPLQIYNNDINRTSEIGKDELWDYVEMMRGDDEARISKNYKDLDYLLTTTHHSKSHPIILVLYSVINREASIEALLEGIDRPYVIAEIQRVDVGFMIFYALFDMHRGETITENSHYQFEYAHLYESYFENSTNSEYKDIIANAMVHISDREGLELFMNYIDTHYISSSVDYGFGKTPADYTSENVIAEYMTKVFKSFKRPMASELLVEFYKAHSSDENLKRKLRKAFSEIANEITVEQLYYEASILPVFTLPVNGTIKEPDSIYVEYFKNVKFYNKEMGPFITETLSQKYSFENPKIKAQIAAIFVKN